MGDLPSSRPSVGENLAESVEQNLGENLGQSVGQNLEQNLGERIGDTCARYGLDLTRSLRVGWYNQLVEPAHRLPDFGRPSCLAVIVGNTRALWPHLARALRADAGLAGHPDPVDQYCERVLGAAVADVPAPCILRFAHEPPPRVAIQRLAHVAGLAYLSACHLSVHPVYGPWIALRAVVVVDVDGPAEAPALAAPCDCAGHCGPHLAAALARAGAGTPESAEVKRDWRAWLAVRDACPVGREHRYSEQQIRYHYTNDPAALPGNGAGDGPGGGPGNQG
jgi:methylmalonic aciduria homocystinuria type C protein